ncbi:hypothetical protein F5X99DRAFT_402932 [Biscogniauxia marginata]|nr:hypothetical protein F5X99DRAFT_402932 [Biscogniauxia marginata]
MATFQTLPFDIHWEVARHLDIESAQALKKCNHYFHDNINLQALPAASWKAFLSRAEALPENAELYACYTCKRLRPGHCFGDYQITSWRRGKLGKASATNFHPRYCWDCAAAHRLSPHSRRVRKQGRPYYLCWKCRRWTPRYRRCGIPGSAEASQRNRDDDYESPDWVCWSDDGSASPRTLQDLPLAVQRRIFALLGYRGAIMLAQTSRHFRAYVEPRECAPLHDKFRFVRDLALRTAVTATTATATASATSDSSNSNSNSNEGDGGGEQRLACYGCFRVRGRAKFNSKPNLDEAARPGRFWTRRCWACNARYFDPAAGLFREELEARVVCGGCQLLKMRGEPCGGCGACLEGAERSTRVASDLRSGSRGPGTALRRYVGVVAVDRPLLCCVPGLMFFFFSLVTVIFWARVSMQRLGVILGGLW